LNRGSSCVSHVGSVMVPGIYVGNGGAIADHITNAKVYSASAARNKPNTYVVE